MASTERELVRAFEVARKAADAAQKSGSPADVDRCVDAIRILREVPVTVKVLVETQVGKKLRSHLTKHPLRKIQKAASDLCELWKRKVIEETSKKKGSHSSEKGGINTEPSSSNGSKIEKNEMNERMKVDNLSKAENFKVEKTSLDQKSGINGTIYRETIEIDKNTKEEKKPSTTNGKFSAANQPPKLTSMVKCNDAVRDKNRELFAEALSKVYAEAHKDIKEEVEACDPIRTAVLLESVMFEKLGRSSGVHKQKYRSILFNLKDQNNPDLRRRVLLGHIKPENLINMTAEEMASDKRKLENQQIKEKALFDCERGMAAKASTDQFKCGRCGQRKCTYYQMQTRSADEPMTTFVTCVNCNNHWKFC